MTIFWGDTLGYTLRYDMIKKIDPKNHSGFLNLGISRGGFWTKIDDFIDFSHSNLLCISADFYTFKIKISTKNEINMQDICYIKQIPLKFFFFSKSDEFFFGGSNSPTSMIFKIIICCTDMATLLVGHFRNCFRPTSNPKQCGFSKKISFLGDLEAKLWRNGEKNEKKH